MAQDPERAARITDEVLAELGVAHFSNVKPFSDVDVEQVAALRVLVDQRLQAARVLHGINAFSPEEIRTAQQYIASLEPVEDSEVDGLQTVQRALEFQTHLTAFSNADESLIQKALVGSGISYGESNKIKVARLLERLGYIPAEPYAGETGVRVLKPQLSRTEKFLWWTVTIGSPKLEIGAVRFEHTYEGRDWVYEVFGRQHVNEGLSLAKLFKEQLNHEVFVGLKSEYTRLIHGNHYIPISD